MRRFPLQAQDQQVRGKQSKCSVFCRRGQRQRNRSRKKGKSTSVKSSLLPTEESNPYNANSPQGMAIESYVCINIFSHFLILFLPLSVLSSPPTFSSFFLLFSPIFLLLLSLLPHFPSQSQRPLRKDTHQYRPDRSTYSSDQE